jgi:hypothetical protein
VIALRCSHGFAITAKVSIFEINPGTPEQARPGLGFYLLRVKSKGTTSLSPIFLPIL